MEPLVKTNTYERGSYHCFDPSSFEVVRKVWTRWKSHPFVYCLTLYHCIIVLPPIGIFSVGKNLFDLQDNFVVQYDMLEKRPVLPQH